MTEVIRGFDRHDLISHANREDIRIRIVESRKDDIYDMYVYLKNELIAYAVDSNRDTALEGLDQLFGENLDRDAPEEVLMMMDILVEYVRIDEDTRL